MDEKEKELEAIMCPHNILDAIEDEWGVTSSKTGRESVHMFRMYQCKRCEKIFMIHGMSEINTQKINKERKPIHIEDV